MSKLNTDNLTTSELIELLIAKGKRKKMAGRKRGMALSLLTLEESGCRMESSDAVECYREAVVGKPDSTTLNDLWDISTEVEFVAQSSHEIREADDSSHGERVLSLLGYTLEFIENALELGILHDDLIAARLPLSTALDQIRDATAVLLREIRQADRLRRE